ncbi:SLAC1 anion channel family protein [Zavarzinia sp.]|uniref:SLAC1 anion channel family protein n=1 Tax=Zavarzinia sp. TaxID=2027920 RepID=UPI003BB79304
MIPANGPAGAGGKLQHLPLPLFAVPMGVGGLGLAWREAGRSLGAPVAIGEILLGLALLLWLVIAGLHLVRAFHHPGSLRADLRHPIRSAFAGAIGIGLMIVAGGLVPHAPDLATAVWLIAVGFHLLVGIWTVRGLLMAPREAATLVPPLLIPLVGNIVAPIFGVRLGFETLSWMLFGLGALLWAMIQPLILGRIISGPPLPERLLPTLGILLAPPAVGTVALAGLTGGYGPGPLAIFGLAVVVATILLSMTGHFARCAFAISWWGWTFPAAAFSVAVSGVVAAHPGPALAPLAWLVLAIASAIATFVSLRTLRAAAAGHLLQPEG